MRRIVEAPGTLETSETSLSVTLELPSDLVWFEGHFPARALLPGVTQLQWVLEYAARWLGPVKLREVLSTEFVRPILPGETLQLCLTKGSDAADGLTLRFEYRVIGQGSSVQVALGRLKVAR